VATTHLALLRGINLGNVNKLPMKDLKELFAETGCENVRTYIQSGNVVFRTELGSDRAGAALAKALAAHMGRPIDVMVRDAEAMRDALARNPFPDAEPARVAVLFCAEPVPKGLVDGLTGPDGEVVVAAGLEVYVHYVQGMGRSKLKLPKALGVCTVRNVNTVAKLVALADAPGGPATKPKAPRPTRPR
jgi:uncharacterized protein (DUF1697 family)